MFKGAQNDYAVIIITKPDEFCWKNVAKKMCANIKKFVPCFIQIIDQLYL